jgi:hypothetical protein
METLKLKMRIGAHEFEAEGPQDVVKEQFEAFKALIAAVPTAPLNASFTGYPGTPPSITAGAQPGSQTFEPPLVPALDTSQEALARIMKVDDRIISLTARARNTDDAVLLLLYGQKALRVNDAVTGAEMIDGLSATGIKVQRVDRLLEKASDIGDVIVVGSGRAKRYRLTNSGFAKAKAIANDLIATVA